MTTTAPPAPAGHHQIPKPDELHLAEELQLPGGRRVEGAKARLYDLLQITRRRGLRWPVGRQTAPEGWVPSHILREPWSGGLAGDRRVRELRALGVPIEKERFEGEAGDSATFLWRLASSAPLQTPAPLDSSAKPPAPPQPLSSRTIHLHIDLPATEEARRAPWLPLITTADHPLALHENLVLAADEKKAAALYLAELRDRWSPEWLEELQRLLPDGAIVYDGPPWALNVVAHVLTGLGATVLPEVAGAEGEATA